jgi:hypothetical protein
VNFQLVWTDQLAPELRNKFWSVRVTEYGDDRIWYGAVMTAFFKIERVPHFNVQFEVKDSPTFGFFPQEKASDFIVNVTCWSP